MRRETVAWFFIVGLGVGFGVLMGTKVLPWVDHGDHWRVFFAIFIPLMALSITGIMRDVYRRVAFDLAVRRAVSAPWRIDSPPPGPWAELGDMPATFEVCEPPFGSELQTVLREGTYGPEVVVEASDHGLCLVRLVGVAASFTRWTYSPIAKHEVHQVEDGQVSLYDAIVRRPAVIVDVAHDGRRLRAWRTTGDRLPVDLLPIDGDTL